MLQSYSTVFFVCDLDHTRFVLGFCIQCAVLCICVYLESLVLGMRNHVEIVFFVNLLKYELCAFF